MKSYYHVTLLGQFAEKQALQIYYKLKRPFALGLSVMTASDSYSLNYGNATFIISNPSDQYPGKNNQANVYIVFTNELEYLINKLKSFPNIENTGLVIVSKNTQVMLAAQEIGAQVLDDRQNWTDALVFDAILKAAHKRRTLNWNSSNLLDIAILIAAVPELESTDIWSSIMGYAMPAMLPSHATLIESLKKEIATRLLFNATGNSPDAALQQRIAAHFDSLNAAEIPAEPREFVHEPAYERIEDGEMYDEEMDLTPVSQLSQCFFSKPLNPDEEKVPPATADLRPAC